MIFDLLDFFDSPLNEQQKTQLRELGMNAAVDLHSRVKKIKGVPATTPRTEDLQKLETTLNQEVVS